MISPNFCLVSPALCHATPKLSLDFRILLLSSLLHTTPPGYLLRKKKDEKEVSPGKEAQTQIE